MTTPSYVALADQYNAATRDATHIIHNLARAERVTVHRDSTDPWITNQIRALVAALTSGNGRLCPHLSSSPRVVYAAAWDPGQLTCERCTDRLVPDWAEDLTCDRCRAREVQYIGAAAFGPVVLSYGLCLPCLTATTLDVPEDHR